MKKYDFIIVYEVKPREFGTVCLLKYELERRGFSVCVVNTWQTMGTIYEPVEADVMLTFALCDSGQLEYTLSFARNVKAVVNMQWEQILSAEDNVTYQICEKALQAYHVSWGNNNARWLMEQCHLPCEKVILAGHPAMDFTKPRFKDYYIDRKRLLDQYDINSNKKMALFISSFSFVGLPEDIIESDLYQDTAVSPKYFREISLVSQKEILTWLEHAALNTPDVTIVYRPHPAEANNPELKKMEDMLSNFFVIGDYSIQQWIMASDKVYTWYSTGAADVYYSGKDFAILRPVKIPEQMEVTLYYSAKFITDQQAFQDSLVSNKTMQPISSDVYDDYYHYQKDEYSYEVICDRCEKILAEAKKKEEPAFPEYEPQLRKKYILAYKYITTLARKIIGDMYEIMPLRKMMRLFGEKVIRKAEFESYTNQSARKHGFTKREMENTVNKIAETIKANGVGV